MPQQNEAPASGAIPLTGGLGSVVRIPLPGTDGLAVELKPRGWTPKGGTTSTLFIQDMAGKRHLRLDYGFNKSTGTVNYHWNQAKMNPTAPGAKFPITNHQPAGKGASVLYHGSKVYRWLGKRLIVVGAVIDIYSIVQAENKSRQLFKVVSGWGGAYLGCKVVGGAGGIIGTFIEPGGGTAVGAGIGCFAGGIGGYWGFSWAAGELYDWTEGTVFRPLPTDVM